MITYAVTCNHIHLLVVDSHKEIISKSMQLLSGATGQAYNSRKNRKGAFWEDRFYTTAIESGVHLLRCMTYIELNMIRAGAVKHPEDWEFCGYNEILDPPKRYRLIDRKALLYSLILTTGRFFNDFKILVLTAKAGLEDKNRNENLRLEVNSLDSLNNGHYNDLKDYNNNLRRHSCRLTVT